MARRSLSKIQGAYSQGDLYRDMSYRLSCGLVDVCPESADSTAMHRPLLG